MINAEKLTFGFSSTLLFQNISFNLPKNCHCALIGSNGTGKTTLMNLIRDPEHYIFDGKILLDNAGRIGYVSQFAIREGDQSVTVYDYLCQDFVALEKSINETCEEMGVTDDMDAVMERYQALLDESDAMDAAICSAGRYSSQLVKFTPLVNGAGMILSCGMDGCLPLNLFMVL